MKAIELIGHIDDQHQLHVELPATVQPGPVRITLHLATDEHEQDDWLEFINESWAMDWNDPREDIYTLDDGKQYSSGGQGNVNDSTPGHAR